MTLPVILSSKSATTSLPEMCLLVSEVFPHHASITPHSCI